jgi:hypothetical protein
VKLSIEARIRELKADGMITLKIGHCFNLAPQLDRDDAHFIDKSLSLTIPTTSAVTPR